MREVLGLDDIVFHLSLTPNRPDAMGIVGVARELAAHFGLPLQVPDDESAAVVETLICDSPPKMNCTPDVAPSAPVLQAAALPPPGAVGNDPAVAGFQPLYSPPTMN